MAFLFYILFAAAVVALDQFTKYLTLANIALYEHIPFIPRSRQCRFFPVPWRGKCIPVRRRRAGSA